jgi:hypothetical protein
MYVDLQLTDCAQIFIVTLNQYFLSKALVLIFKEENADSSHKGKFVK